MNNIQVLGKFLDQPILVSKFQKAVPAILTAGATAYTIKDVMSQKKENRPKRALQTGITMGVTVATALAAPHVASALTKRALPNSLEVVKSKNKELVDTFVNTTKLNESTKSILEKGKDKIISFKEVKTLYSDLKSSEKGKELLAKLIPDPENIQAKDIFSEIGYLSVYGAVPVVGGILGGITADKVTDKENWKSKIPNKIKEGSYQYLANIFMCNVGAGAALALLEKAKITSKAARAVGMTAGIIATGIIGGSKIANFMADKIIDPACNKIFGTKKKLDDKKIERYLDINFVDHKKDIFQKLDVVEKKKERTPEALDICLHTDDIATVSLLSGLKWIEPALPVMYALSGYRAGTGYRN